MQFLTTFYVVFFFSKICIFFLCIFFFLEKIKLHSLTRFKPLYFFFPAPEKKNTPFLLTHSNLNENVTKVIFSREIKKYGTFDIADVKTSTNILDYQHRSANIMHRSVIFRYFGHRSAKFMLHHIDL